MKTVNGTNTPSPLKQMQSSGDQTPTPRRPSPPRRVSTSRKVPEPENTVLEPTSSADLPASEALDKGPPKLNQIDLATRPKGDGSDFSPKPLLGENHSKPRVKRHPSKRAKDVSPPFGSTERSSSMIRDPAFGECANDAIVFRKDAKAAQHTVNKNNAAASFAAFEESVSKKGGN